MRLVPDTNLVVSALLGGGGPMHLLEAGRSRQVEPFSGAPMLAELEEILGYVRPCEGLICSDLLPGSGVESGPLAGLTPRRGRTGSHHGQVQV